MQHVQNGVKVTWVHVLNWNLVLPHKYIFVSIHYYSFCVVHEIFLIQ